MGIGEQTLVRGQKSNRRRRAGQGEAYKRVREKQLKPSSGTG